MNARADRFPLFDGLRGLAALSVLVFHVTFGGFNGLPSPLRELGAHLDVGVAIFFVVSGFLLYRPFVLAHLRGERMPFVRSYAWRRFLRIVPGYWVALTVVTLWLGLPGVFTASGIPTYYGFLQAWSADTFTGGIGQAWTLCVEVGFYLMLPVWALLVRRVAGPRRVVAVEAVALALLFVAASAYLAAVLAAGSGTASVRLLPGLVDQFALGMALALASAWWQTRDAGPGALGVLGRVPSVGWLVAAAAFAASATLEGGVLGEGGASAHWLVQHELYSLTAVGLVVPAVLAGAGAGAGVPGRVLGTRFLLWIGLWSYGIYLYHVAVIEKLTDPVSRLMPDGAGWQTLGLGVAVLAVTAAIAAVSYRLVERPALALKSRFPLFTPAARGEAIAEPAPASPPLGPGRTGPAEPRVELPDAGQGAT